MVGEKILPWAKRLFGVHPSTPESRAERAAHAAKPVGEAVGDALVAFGELTRSIREARAGAKKAPARGGRSQGRSHSRSTRSPRRTRASRSHTRVRDRAPAAAPPPPPVACDVAIVEAVVVAAPRVRPVPPARSA